MRSILAGYDAGYGDGTADGGGGGFGALPGDYHGAQGVSYGIAAAGGSGAAAPGLPSITSPMDLPAGLPEEVGPDRRTRNFKQMGVYALLALGALAILPMLAGGRKD